MRQTVWQLRGSTDHVIECCVDRRMPLMHEVMVNLGHETLLRERYPDEDDALARAIQIRERLLQSGTWTVVATVARGLPSR